MLGAALWLNQSQRPFRRRLRQLSRPTFGAAKVGKTARAAKAPGKLRRVRCDTRRHRGRWVAAEPWVHVGKMGSERCLPPPRPRHRGTGTFGRYPNFNIRHETRPRQPTHSNWHVVSPKKIIEDEP